MIKSFFKVAIRFFWRNKGYTILNYLCLTFGLTCFIISVLYVNRSLGFNKFHSNYHRLYAVEANVTFFNGDRFPKALLSASLTDKLKEAIPEFEAMGRIANKSYVFVSGDKEFSENGIYADEFLWTMFSFPLVSGDPSISMKGTNPIIISERMAIRFFGSVNCLGKSLIVKDNVSQEGFNVSGIMKDIPAQSSLMFDFVIPFSKFLSDNPGAIETGAAANQVWVLLNNNANRNDVNNKLRDLIKKQETTLNQELFLFPLKEKALYSYSGGRRVWRDMQYVVLAGSLGLAILLIACFNYINLTIALNIRRNHEAGIKKVVGASKSVIMFQYLTETFLLTIISFLTSIDLAKILINGINTMLRANVQFNFSDIHTIFIFVAIAIFTSLISGYPPALYLSSSNPVSILKGKVTTSHSFSTFRQSLIVFQFTVPVILIIIMMIIKTQDRYIRNYDIGFDKDKLVILNNSKNLENHEESLKAELLSVPGIETVSFTSCIPTRGTPVSNEVTWEGRDASEKQHFWCINTDMNFKNAVTLKLTEGRYFDKSFPSDSGCYVINDVAARVIGYENPLGRTITLEGKKGTIIGVFKDFHVVDLAGPYTPTIISLKPEGRNNILISFSSGTFSSIAEKIEAICRKYEPESVFQVNLFSDIHARTELTSSSNLVGVAFIIALILACLGLSGLASFTAETRTKEIGIRKANGATTFSIVQMLGRNYSKWLAIAIIIAIPFALLLGKVFLSRFNFRTSIPVWAFIAGPLIAYIVAVIAVSWRSWRVASRNPVESLRYE